MKLQRLKLENFPPPPSHKVANKIIGHGTERPSHFWDECIVVSTTKGPVNLQPYTGRDLQSEIFIGLADEQRELRVETGILRIGNQSPLKNYLQAELPDIANGNIAAFDFVIKSADGKRINEFTGSTAIAWSAYMAPKLLESIGRERNQLDYIRLNWEVNGDNFIQLNRQLNQGASLLTAIKSTWSYRRISDMLAFKSIAAIVELKDWTNTTNTVNYQVLLSRGPQPIQVPLVTLSGIQSTTQYISLET